MGEPPLWFHNTYIHPVFRGRVAQWIRRLPTKQKIAGSIPAVVTFKKSPIALHHKLSAFAIDVLVDEAVWDNHLLKEVTHHVATPCYLFHALLWVFPRESAHVPVHSTAAPHTSVLKKPEVLLTYSSLHIAEQHSDMFTDDMTETSPRWMHSCAALARTRE